MTYTLEENILREIDFDNDLPKDWHGVDLKQFSADKSLFEFQQKALKNALKTLWLFYEKKKNNKQQFFSLYNNDGKIALNPYSVKGANKRLLLYDKNYSVENNEISFDHFINRISFWMATGSGKTLVIIKLIEILGNLILMEKLPPCGILFLAHRENLINQFKKLVDDFNQFSSVKINLIQLKSYDSIRNENPKLFSNNEIKVFYYRSDLISDERKENIIDFRDYDNNGQWFILLDEAHKGHNEDSKRQILYSILSRNGFLFNFSATFTEASDNATCAYNFNLEKFISHGYGKNIYISKSNITGFNKETNFSSQEKQIIVLKTLILQTYINKNFKKISNINSELYHKPMLLTLVNSVNPKKLDEGKEKYQPDLEMFFKEIEKVGKNQIASGLLERAKNSLADELHSACYFFGGKSLKICENSLSTIEYRDILKSVFNAEQPGNIEVLRIPGNNQEIAFKLQTSEKAFALIRIGDISGWIKTILQNKETTGRYTQESFFSNINDRKSDINILMGSRTFYEGWDSNRPNIILFINIGTSKDSKKFVLQSIGRGVRIEPVSNERQRLESLHIRGKIEASLYDNLKKHVAMLESLFIFGTNASNLKNIIDAMKSEAEHKKLGDFFVVNKEVENKILLIPTYKDSPRLLIEDTNIYSYQINEQDFETSAKLLKHIGDKIVLVKYNCQPRVLNKLKKTIDKPETYYNYSEDRILNNPEVSIKRILDYLGLKSKHFDKFNKIDKEIIHFEHIEFRVSARFDDIKEAIRKVKESKKQNSFSFDTGEKLDIRHIAQHYYNPLLISRGEKIKYLTHIIDVSSEVEFIKNLLNNIDCLDHYFDWWMFSKIDETLDSVYIPYCNPKSNNMAKFNPDFIFWLKKGKKYSIVLIDPKSGVYTDYEHKADGYKRLFGEPKNERIFQEHGMDIKVYLRFFNKNALHQPSENYFSYWIDGVDEIRKMI